MSISTICFDADDTLWENLKYFHETEAEVARLMAPYATAKEVEAHTLLVEQRNIPLMGFGVLSFIHSSIEAMIEISDGAVPAKAIDHVLRLGRGMLDHPVDILPGVETVLKDLSRKYRLVMITKGAVRHQERKIAASGLVPYFDAVRIVEDKRPEDYADIFEDLGVAPASCVMVGNSMKSDVVAPIEAGAHAVFLPHEREWAVETAQAPDGTGRYHTLSAMSDLPALIEKIKEARG